MMVDLDATVPACHQDSLVEVGWQASVKVEVVDIMEDGVDVKLGDIKMETEVVDVSGDVVMRDVEELVVEMPAKNRTVAKSRKHLKPRLPRFSQTTLDEYFN